MISTMTPLPAMMGVLLFAISPALPEKQLMEVSICSSAGLKTIIVVNDAPNGGDDHMAHKPCHACLCDRKNARRSARKI